MKTRPCANCGAIWHTKSYHKQKPRTALKQTKPWKRTAKAMKRTKMSNRGKHYYKWLSVRASWIELHPGPWECYYCRVFLDGPYMTLDHKVARVRDYSLRYVLSNLVPCCWPCNKLKGSLSIEKFLEKYPYYKTTINDDYWRSREQTIGTGG